MDIKQKLSLKLQDQLWSDGLMSELDWYQYGTDINGGLISDAFITFIKQWKRCRNTQQSSTPRGVKCKKLDADYNHVGA